MKFLVRTFISWLPLAVAVTGMCLLAYATVQQNYRQSLNDPQIQMAEDGAAHLAAGDVPASIVPRGQTVDIAQSLAPWIAIYDSSGHPLESSAILDGAPPQLPIGVFDQARFGTGKDTREPNENRVSWQPRAEVRSAVVVVWTPATKQFVVVGRNMREVERREGRLGAFVGLAWVVMLVATFFTQIIAGYLRKRPELR